MTDISSSFSTMDKMGRHGIIDVGSNSVRLVVFDGATRSPAYFFNEKVHCALGASLLKTGRLSQEGKRRALRAIKRFALLAEGMQLSSLSAIATAAVREACDGRQFCDEVEAKTGIVIKVTSGEDEARLAAQGVILGWPDAEGLVCDLGGSSTELVEVTNRRIGEALTTRIGHLSNSQQNCTGKNVKKLVRKTIAQTRHKLHRSYHTLFLVGGSWRVIARLDMERNNYPLKVLNEYRITPKSALKTISWANRLGYERLRMKDIVQPTRLQSLSVSGIILKELIAQYEPSMISVSAYGIREGLLFERMPEPLRRRDPLIEACRYSEYSSARLPGFGQTLFHFVKPLFNAQSEHTHRLIQAACLLHDVTWRAHPDYRAHISFDNATRANLGGIDHPGRIFLALSLFHRYRNQLGDPPGNYIHLVDANAVRQATILGKAMRFGAMFSATSTEKIGRLKFRAKKHVLTLFLPKSFEDMYGEVVEARFEALARAMDSRPELETI